VWELVLYLGRERERERRRGGVLTCWGSGDVVDGVVVVVDGILIDGLIGGRSEECEGDAQANHKTEHHHQ